MKISRSLPFTLVAAGTLANSAAAATLINDTFAGSAVNTTIWQSVMPFPSSQVYVSGGDAILRAGGKLVSVNPVVGSLAAPLDIRGSFAFTGNRQDFLNITLRTDGVPSDAWGNVGGAGVIISGPDFNYVNICSLGSGGSFNHHIFAFSSPVQVNTYYDFRITDDGGRISFYFGDLVNPMATVNTTYRVGDRLVLSDRDEWGPGDSIVNAGSQINVSYLTVDVIPEPATLGILSLAAALWAYQRSRAL